MWRIEKMYENKQFLQINYCDCGGGIGRSDRFGFYHFRDSELVSHSKGSPWIEFAMIRPEGGPRDKKIQRSDFL